MNKLNCTTLNGLNVRYGNSEVYNKEESVYNQVENVTQSRHGANQSRHQN